MDDVSSGSWRACTSGSDELRLEKLEAAIQELQEELAEVEAAERAAVRKALHGSQQLEVDKLKAALEESRQLTGSIETQYSALQAAREVEVEALPCAAAAEDSLHPHHAAPFHVSRVYHVPRHRELDLRRLRLHDRGGG